MKRLYTFLLTFITLLLVSHLGQSQPYCQIHGNVFITDNKGFAQFTFYEEESESFSDLSVFVVDSRVFADRSGLWHLVDSPALADFVLFREKERGWADFKVFFTETESFAGCQNP